MFILTSFSGWDTEKEIMVVSQRTAQAAKLSFVASALLPKPATDWTVRDIFIHLNLQIRASSFDACSHRQTDVDKSFNQQ